MADRLTGNIVALKRVLVAASDLQFASQATSSDPLLALALEFRTLAGLRHPHIMGVLDYGFTDFEGRHRQPYFTMPVIDSAQTLTQVAADLDTSGKVRLLVEMLQALAYLHRRSILHRDLKPANLLVTADGFVQVIDFGLALAQAQSSINLHAGTVGTLAYMAPELLMETPASIASDLYGVGVIAYEVFVGQHPFAARNIGTLVNGILHDTPDTSSAGGVQAVVRRRLARVPSDTQNALKLAAVAGRQLDLDMMRLLSGYELDAWLTACASASVLELVEDRWRFSHDKLREMLLADLTEVERPLLHRQVAEALEAIYPDQPDQAMTLAYHWHEAGVPTREVGYVLQVGDQAYSYGNNGQAVEFLRRGLALWNSSPPGIQAQRTLYEIQLEPVMHFVDLSSG